MQIKSIIQLNINPNYKIKFITPPEPGIHKYLYYDIFLAFLIIYSEENGKDNFDIIFVIIPKTKKKPFFVTSDMDFKLYFGKE